MILLFAPGTRGATRVSAALGSISLFENYFLRSETPTLALSTPRYRLLFDIFRWRPHFQTFLSAPRPLIHSTIGPGKKTDIPPRPHSAPAVIPRFFVCPITGTQCTKPHQSSFSASRKSQSIGQNDTTISLNSQLGYVEHTIMSTTKPPFRPATSAQRGYLSHSSEQARRNRNPPRKHSGVWIQRSAVPQVLFVVGAGRHHHAGILHPDLWLKMCAEQGQGTGELKGTLSPDYAPKLDSILMPRLSSVGRPWKFHTVMSKISQHQKTLETSLAGLGWGGVTT